MYAVGRLGSYISRGVYSVSGPFHPFGGAVDIIVVEQPDGSFKSSPWYVRFGKFQGVLKMKEKIVRISVNGVEASLCMYLDHKGEAYFVKEIQGCGEDGESVLSASPSSSSSGDDAGGQSNRQTFKSKSFNYDDDINRSETLINSCRSQILGLMFGRRSLKEERFRTEGEDGPLVGRVDSLDRAEMAADLLDLNWSTSLATKKKKKRKDVGSRFLACDAANLDDDGSKVKEDCDERKEKSSKEEERTVDLTDLESEVDLSIGSSSDESSYVRMELLASTEQYNDGKKLDINLENKHCAGSDFHLSRPTNVPASEEIQFIFSDLDEIEVAKRNLNQELSDQFRQGGGGAELSNDADERSSVENLGEETAAFANKLIKSSSIHICSTSLNDEFKQLVKSMPNTRSDIKDLDSYLIQVPLSQSLDINTLEFTKDKEHLVKHQVNIAVAEDINVHPSVGKDIALGLVQEMSVCRHMEMDIDAAAAEAFDTEKLDLRKLMLDKVEQSLHEDSSTKMMGGSWRLWPFSFNKSRSVNHTRDFLDENTAESITKNKNALKTKIVKKRLTTPTSEQLASLNLKQGSNTVTFTFSTAMLGNQRVEARIYLWKWNTRVIISDVDGTITKSDVLGQFMPMVGMDWSQAGVTHLFSAIKENGYQMLFLSARAISQAYHTRQFLFNLKQNDKCLPDGPVVISPDGLFPSLYREVIRRAPHEFKISCLEDIKALFPPDCNPFYAGFGNRYTDEISYLKVGIPKGKIFIINPKGQVAVNRQINTKSYTSLHALVNGMFPHASTSHQQEDYNCWNYWKLPPVDIDM